MRLFFFKVEVIMKKFKRSFFLRSRIGEVIVFGKINLMMMMLSGSFFIDLKKRFLYCNNI